MSTDYNHLIVKIEKKTQIITINRPEVYNALTKDAKFEIVKAIREANRNDQVKSIILTGSGKAFTTGQDLNDRTLHAGENKKVDLGHTLETEWNPLIMTIRDSKKIVIGAINGVCAGAGLSVALACDLIISGPQVKFISGFSKLGLAPDAGSTSILTKALGPKRTLDFFLFNKPLLSEELKEVGLVNEISENLLTTALEYAEKIADLPPMAIRAIKSNILYAIESTFDQTVERETSAQRLLGNSKDYQEGINAFFEKRKPVFTGE